MYKPMMLTIKVTCFVALLGMSVHASVQEVQAPIKKVTVYPGRAKVSRIVSMDFGAGEQSCIIKDLPLSVDVTSLRASAYGVKGITLLGFNHREEYHIQSSQQNVAELETKIRLFDENDLQRIKDRIASFEEQKKLLALITKGAGEQASEGVERGGLDVDQWQAAFRFVGDRQLEVNDSIRLAKAELGVKTNHLQKLNAQLSSIRSPQRRTTRTAQIDLNLETAGSVVVTLEYMIPGAGWTPLYDARLSEEDTNVRLDYFAEVKQRTGEDWYDVELTLSTVEPSHGTGPAELDPWYLTLAAPPPVPVMDELTYGANGITVGKKGEVYIRGGRAGEVAFIVDGVSAEEPLSELGSAGAKLSLVTGMISTYATEYRVPRPETIPSSSQGVRTTIASLSLPGRPDLVCRPTLMEGVYRFAAITNNEETVLMPGRVSVFAESNYLGTTALIDPVVPGQEFELPFGLNNFIEVDREVYSENQSQNDHWLSGDTKVRHETEIEIKLTNNGRQPALIDLEEALPVSQDERVKVKVDGVAPDAVISDNKEIVSWKLRLEPGAEQIVTFRYRIEHAPGLTIVGL
ncbi:MAG: mucoidy inhibitor MuiA family protein [candidate division Zixibacteria bacterium]|nr:mucoidy inhibitor MuiA family protein [candidate division Zixibacteria bacterium]MDH3936711.1 mucoidy inhibitor MuiA family protein [candidate division Zixibacteria bacterium]MDH4032564.1 mucoidy inhibitor MuiA family protein [candidate division Zixibacteria bacterium]